MALMTVYLDEILAWHRQRAAADGRSLEALLEQAKATPPARGFAAALRQASQAGSGGIIAEIKRRSPSKGDLRPQLDPAEIARSYQAGGASCLSVLTDTGFFAGSAADLQAARQACELPVLRKDFTVAPADLCDARIMGADAVLLIVSALEPAELADFIGLAGELGVAALVEAHTQAEIELAAEAGAQLIGINQRDLRTFEVNRELALELHDLLPSEAVKVAESAIRDARDAKRLLEAGYDGVLVGESFITAPDPGLAVQEFKAHL